MDERSGCYLHSDILCRCNGRRGEKSNTRQDRPGLRGLQFLYGLHFYYFASLRLCGRFPHLNTVIRGLLIALQGHFMFFPLVSEMKR